MEASGRTLTSRLHAADHVGAGVRHESSWYLVRPYGRVRVCLRFCVEDDERWYRKDVLLSSMWIDDVIKTLQAVKARLDSSEFRPDIEDGRRYGVRFQE